MVQGHLGLCRHTKLPKYIAYQDNQYFDHRGLHPISHKGFPLVIIKVSLITSALYKYKMKYWSAKSSFSGIFKNDSDLVSSFAAYFYFVTYFKLNKCWFVYIENKNINRCTLTLTLLSNLNVLILVTAVSNYIQHLMVSITSLFYFGSPYSAL